MRVGRRDRFVEISPNSAPLFLALETIAASNDRYRFRVSVTTMQGWTQGEATIRVTPPEELSGVQLMGHADLFDAERTRIVEMPCDTALGRLDCSVYLLDERPSGRDRIVMSFFAKSLPGPPVVHVERVCGRLSFLRMLVAHVDGH